MTLISIEFIFFFIAALLIYYVMPKGCRWVALLIASLAFFLLSGAPHTIAYLIASIISSYIAGRIIWRCKALWKKKTALVIAIIINAGILTALRYSDFLLSNAQGIMNLFGVDISFKATGWIASIGVSFYTLMVIGYLCDVYWGISEPQSNPFKLALFVGYFPQLTSGPISKYEVLKDTLFHGHSFDYQTVAFGFQRIAWGTAKKLIVAERIAPFVNMVFRTPGEHAGLYVWLGAILFVVQLYADFSGSMDIVLGVSECFGIRLPANFKTPFFSRTVQEIWQRWHITLGVWFRDYIMYPILKSKAWTKMGRRLRGKGKAAKKLPSFLGMLILWVGIGIWHGGGWQFVFQGLWFWAVIVIGQIIKPLFRGKMPLSSGNASQNKSIKTMCAAHAWHFFQIARTFLVFTVGLLFFRSSSLPGAVTMLRASLDFSAGGAASLLEMLGGAANITIVLFGIAMMAVVDLLQYHGHSVRSLVAKQNIIVRWVIYYALIFSILFFGAYGSGYNPADFIYRGF